MFALTLPRTRTWNSAFGDFDQEVARHFAALKGHAPETLVKEEEQEFTLRLALPGVAKENLKIEMVDEQLLIDAMTSEEFADFKRHTQRSFRVPPSVDRERVSAELKQGVLTVRLPKAEALKPRQIEVQIA